MTLKRLEPVDYNVLVLRVFTSQVRVELAHREFRSFSKNIYEYAIKFKYFLAVFPFHNSKTMEHKKRILNGMRYSQ